MKSFTKPYIAGIITMLIILATTPIFADSKNSIQVVFGRVKLMVNGSSVAEQTLLYNDTTYVPLRAAAEILGMEVKWDEATSTATLLKKSDVVTNTESPEQAPKESVAPKESQPLSPKVDDAKGNTTIVGEEKKIDAIPETESPSPTPSELPSSSVSSSKPESDIKDEKVKVFYYDDYKTVPNYSENFDVEFIDSYFDKELRLDCFVYENNRQLSSYSKLLISEGFEETDVTREFRTLTVDLAYRKGSITVLIFSDKGNTVIGIYKGE